LENIRGNIRDAFIWVAVDETTDSMSHFIANLLAGNLNIEVPSNPHLIYPKVLHHRYHSTVRRFVNYGLKILWSTRFLEEKLPILYSDVVSYVLKAATALKVFHPNLIYFTCLPHGLQHVAKEFRTKFSQVNKLS
jgi:hypothetical protein